MKHISSVILLLALSVGSVFAQMKSANLDSNSWYSIIAVHSGKALEIAGGVDGKANGLSLQQNVPTGAGNQLFQFTQAQSGYFRITVKHSGKVLEIRDGSLMDHARVQQNEANGKDNQLFTLVQETGGNYRIISRSTGYGFDLLGGVGATSNGVPVIVHPATGAANQAFKIVETKEKLPAPASAMNGGSIIRIDAGSSATFKDADGNVWLADTGFTDGETVDRGTDLKIQNTPNPGLYMTEHYSMTAFSYAVPNGKYMVNLHFAETYDEITGPGQRVFSFTVQGKEFKDFDVWAKAGGGLRAYVEKVPVTVTNGKVQITFTENVQSPEINAIEIIPQP